MEEQIAISPFSDFNKLVDAYMECSKRTLAELLALRDLNLITWPPKNDGNGPLKDSISTPPYAPIEIPNPMPINTPIDRPWPLDLWRLGDVYYTTTVTSKKS